jgi:hypothetical protein
MSDVPATAAPVASLLMRTLRKIYLIATIAGAIFSLIRNQRASSARQPRRNSRGTRKIRPNHADAG